MTTESSVGSASATAAVLGWSSMTLSASILGPYPQAPLQPLTWNE